MKEQKEALKELLREYKQLEGELSTDSTNLKMKRYDELKLTIFDLLLKIVEQEKDEGVD